MEEKIINMIENNTYGNLKEKFNNEILKEIALCFDNEFDDMKKVIENIHSQIIPLDENEQYIKFRDFYIETKVDEINETLKNQFEYYETEDWLSEYFCDYDNSDCQVNYSDYESENKKIKEIVIQLIDRYYEKDFIDICEFEIDYSYWQPKKDIFFSVSNLGEFEVQLDDDIKEILDDDTCKEEIKEDINYYISDNNEYAYNTAPEQILYYTNMNSFFKNVIDCIDIDDRKEIHLVYELYRLIDRKEIENDDRKKLIDLYYGD